MSQILALLLGATRGLSGLPSPTGLAITETHLGAVVRTVQWDPYPSGPGANFIRVYESLNGGGYGQIAQEAISATSSFIDRSVEIDNAASYLVRAFRTSDTLESGNSNIVTFYSPAASPSALVFNRTGPLTYQLTWANNSVHAVAFTVWQSVNGGAFAELVGSIGTTSYNGSWSSLPTDDLEYFVTANRTDPAGPQSGPSNIAEANTAVLPPTLTSAEWEINSQVSLDWVNNMTPEETKIYNSDTENGTYADVGESIIGTGSSWASTFAYPQNKWWRVSTVYNGIESALSNARQAV